MLSRARAAAGLRAEVVMTAVLLGIVVLLIFYPLTFVIKTTILIDGQFSLEGLLKTWARPAIQMATVNTLIVAAGSVALAAGVAIPIAWLVKRSNIPFASSLQRFPIMPMLFPQILGALGWVMLLGPKMGLLNSLILERLGLQANAFTIGATIWVVSLYLVPWVYTLVATGFDTYDNGLSDAARVSGASAFSTLRAVELPMLLPHILGALLLAVVLALESYTIPVMLMSVGGLDVVAVQIKRMGMSYLYPEYSAGSLAAPLLVVALLGTYLQRRMTRGNRFATVHGKGGSGAKVDLGWWIWPAFLFVAVYFLVAIVLPIVALGLVSFLPTWGAPIRWENFTLANYAEVFGRSPALWRAFGISIALAVLTASVVMVISTLAAIFVTRGVVKWGSLVEYLGMISIGIPSMVFGYGALQAYMGPPLALYGTIWALLLAYIGGFFGYGIRSITGAIKQIDPSLEEAARISGASSLRTIVSITLPLVWQGFAAGWLLIFIIAFREHPMSTLLTGPGVSVVSVSMFDLYETGSYTQVAAFSVLVFLFIMVVSVLVGYRPRRLRIRDR